MSGSSILRALLVAVTAVAALAADAKIVLLAGKPSHPPGAHEYNAGLMLIEKWLRQNPGVQPVLVKGGWPEHESVFDGAAAVVIFMDGGAKHPVLAHLDTMSKLMARGAGIACLHYGVDVPPDTGGPHFLDWVGGHYEAGYSTNPINDAFVTQASPRHPVSAGWRSYQMKDEWYYHIRFRDGDARFTPILTAMLPEDSPARETLAWTVERADGGRGFGFTGGHFHSNWGQLEQRRLVTNAILWIAKAKIPSGGAHCDVTAAELTENLDPKPAPRK